MSDRSKYDALIEALRQEREAEYVPNNALPADLAAELSGYLTAFEIYFNPDAPPDFRAVLWRDLKPYAHKIYELNIGHGKGYEAFQAFQLDIAHGSDRISQTPSPTAEEAIEKLRADVAVLAGDKAELIQRLQEAQGEIERLKDALLSEQNRNDKALEIIADMSKSAATARETVESVSTSFEFDVLGQEAKINFGNDGLAKHVNEFLDSLTLLDKAIIVGGTALGGAAGAAGGSAIVLSTKALVEIAEKTWRAGSSLITRFSDSLDDNLERQKLLSRASPKLMSSHETTAQDSQKKTKNKTINIRPSSEEKDRQVIEHEISNALDRLNLDEEDRDESLIKEISLGGFSISDISRLVDLTGLESLDLINSAVSNLTPISELENLENLYLGGCPIDDLSPLSSLYSLKHLEISGTLVTDLSPLLDLPHLNIIEITETPIESEYWRQHMPNVDFYE